MEFILLLDKINYWYNYPLQILINAPALHSFIIRSRKDVPDILEFPNNKHIDLRKLILKYCYFGDDGTRLLANIVSLYPQLEVLSVESCRGLIAADYSLISRLKKLSELNLSDCEVGCVCFKPSDTHVCIYESM
jgi:hypothetical protein